MYLEIHKQHAKLLIVFSNEMVQLYAATPSKYIFTQIPFQKLIIFMQNDSLILNVLNVKLGNCYLIVIIAIYMCFTHYPNTRCVNETTHFNSFFSLYIRIIISILVYVFCFFFLCFVHTIL